MHSMTRSTPLALALVLALTGCATVKYGDKDAEAQLKRLSPIPGKASVYVCRESAMLVGAGNRTTAVVDNRPIGTLKPANFAHVAVEPGAHSLYIKRSPGGDSGVLNFNAQAGEVVILWVGMTAAGFGTLTVDQFSSRAEAERCVAGAEYAVLAE